MLMKVTNSVNRRYYLLPTIVFLAGILIFSLTAGNAFAHMRQLLTIGGKQYLLEVGSVNEPVYVGDKSGVDFSLGRLIQRIL
jgi:hypothetical protein